MTVSDELRKIRALILAALIAALGAGFLCGVLAARWVG